MILNCLVIPFIIITFVVCGPVYLIRACCAEKIEERHNTPRTQERYQMELDDPQLQNEIERLKVIQSKKLNIQ